MAKAGPRQKERRAVEGLIEGRQVHYVMRGDEPGVLGHVEGEHRAATVVRCWGDTPHEGYVNLLVHVDGYNDLTHGGDNLGRADLGFVPQVWATSVFHSEDKEVGTWHWMERA